MGGISALNMPLSTVSTFPWPELEGALSPWIVVAIVAGPGNNRDHPQPVLRITRFPAHRWLASLS